MKLAKKIIFEALERRVRNIVFDAETKNMDKIKMLNLTKLEKQQVYDLWHLRNFTYHKMFKTLVGFDARYVSDSVFQPHLLRALNPMDMARALENKSLYPILFADIPQPEALVANVFGDVLVRGKRSTIDEAISVLKDCNSFIIKPTHDSICGNNVKLVFPQKDDVKAVLNLYGNEYIAQETVKQSELTAIFHRKSLNTFRITTLNINGKSSLCNILFRCGQDDAFVDNGGAGGLLCGVSPEGVFHEVAYDKYYQTHRKTKEGVAFGGHTIPNMNNIVQSVLQWHSEKLPHIGIAGWDIALDENDNPLMIEMNLRCPGVQFEQLCAGEPLFGERTNEVIEYVNSRPLRLTDVIYI